MDFSEYNDYNKELTEGVEHQIPYLIALWIFQSPGLGLINTKCESDEGRWSLFKSLNALKLLLNSLISK